jgi:hypothetical protein
MLLVLNRSLTIAKIYRRIYIGPTARNNQGFGHPRNIIFLIQHLISFLIPGII